MESSYENELTAHSINESGQCKSEQKQGKHKMGLCNPIYIKLKEQAKWKAVVFRDAISWQKYGSDYHSSGNSDYP